MDDLGDVVTQLKDIVLELRCIRGPMPAGASWAVREQANLHDVVQEIRSVNEQQVSLREFDLILTHVESSLRDVADALGSIKEAMEGIKSDTGNLSMIESRLESLPGDLLSEFMKSAIWIAVLVFGLGLFGWIAYRLLGW